MKDVQFLNRPDSFSLLLFRGHVSSALPELFAADHYRELSRFVLPRAAFSEVYEPLRHIGGDKNIVSKGTYEISDFTVVLDPEMVLFLSDALPRFCAHQKTRALALIWERYSQTSVAREIDELGPVRAVQWNDVTRVEEHHAWPELIDSGGPDRLRAVLAFWGAPVDEVFGVVQVMAYLFEA